MLKNRESESTFPVVHPHKPDKNKQVKDMPYTPLMPFTNEKPSIIAIPALGQNGNQQEILKKVFPYPRSSIHIEKGSPSKNIGDQNLRSPRNSIKKHIKKKQVNENSVAFESNGSIVKLLNQEDPTIIVDNEPETNTSTSSEDYNYQLESLLKELDQKNYAVLQYEDLIIKSVKELNIVSNLLRADVSTGSSEKEIIPNQNYEEFLTTAICNLQLSVTSFVQEEKATRSQLDSLMRDNERYEILTTRLKKSLTSLLKKMKKGKDARKSYHIEFPDVPKLSPSIIG